MANFSKNSRAFLTRRWGYSPKGLALRIRQLAETKGFTMIELLVVLTIIGLLAVAAGANYMTSLKRGRDTQRKGDMRKIQQAFEQYYGANQKYDATCANMATGFFVGSYPPGDPQGGTTIDCASQTTHRYCISCTATSYCACAFLERTGEGNATNKSCAYAASGNYFCVSNLQ